MHDSLSPQAVMVVAGYHKDSFNVLKDVLSRTEFKEKFNIKPMDAAKLGDVTFSLMVFICTSAQESINIENQLMQIDETKRMQSVFVILSEDMVDVSPQMSLLLDSGHLLRAPISAGAFFRHAMSALTEEAIRPSKGYRDFGTTRRSLGEILVSNGIISTTDLDQALKHHQETGKRLGECLLELGMITDRERASFLAAQLDAKVATPQQFSNAEMGVVSRIPESLARRNKCIALELNEGDLMVAMQDIQDLRLLDNLRDVTELNIVPVIGTHEEISQAIDRYYRDISTEKDATNLMADLNSEDVEFLKNEDEDADVAGSESASAELGIVRLVNMMIGNAVRDRASDIHIEPQEKSLSIRYRIDGELRRIMTPPKKSHQAIVTRIKILSELDIAERRLPQDGRMAVKIGGREVDLRVSILPTVHGEKAVLRILDKDAFDKAIGNIGFTPSAMQSFERQIRKPYGMVIVTGPTGSGKSTTLYSAIQSVKDVSLNIVTVEDPVEFHMEGVTQVPVRSKVGMTFASALRSILRQDPDVILIGEIRDQETADIAVKMALTGHMVYSTLHTNDAISTITRFIDIGIPPLLLGSCLNLIIAQRLVRRICPKCRKEYTPEPEILAHLNTNIPAGAKFYRGEGCVNCHGSGFKGRIPLFEMLEITPEIRRLIHKSAPSGDILDSARASGMQSIFEMGIQRVLEGETSLEQVIAVAVET